MTVVVDANIVIKWFLDEIDSLPARRVLSERSDLAAPEHVLAEVGQALWRRFRQGEATRAQVKDALTRIPNILDLVPLEEIVADAADMACEISYTVYDCLYVAAAVRYDTYLITADERLLAVLSHTAWRDRARHLRS